MNPNHDERNRMVADAIKEFFPPENKTHEDLLVERQKDISRQVQKEFLSLQAIEPLLISDPVYRYSKMCDLYTDKMRSMSKEELLFIAVMLLTEAHIENV